MTTVSDPVFDRLTGPGGAFEIVEEPVLGQSLPVFKNRFRNLPEMLVDSQRFAEREFMVDGDRRLTYAAHFEQVKKLAQRFGEDYGVGKGDRVAIFAENSMEWDLCFWALISRGAIVVAMNGWWTAAEFDHAWQLSEPCLLLGDDKRLDRLRDASRSMPDLDTPVICLEPGLPDMALHAVDAPDLPAVTIDEDDPALIMFTSGTTGKAKGALISHRTEIGFVQCALFTNTYGMAQWGMTLADRPLGTTLGTAPFFHMSGLGGLILMTRALGDKVILYRGGFDAERVLSIIDSEKVTTWTALGGMGPKIINCPDRQRYCLDSLTALMFGGAPVSESVQSALREIFPNASAAPAIGYGSTESGTVPVSFGGEDYIRHPQATGRLSILHDMQIRDKQGRVQAEGQEGEIWVRSAFLMLGYWRNDAANKDVFDENRWLSTGDIGRFENGLLTLNSRARDMILRSAENIYPTEIENRLDAHPAVRESAVFGVDDAVHGQAVKAVVVLNSPDAADIIALKAWAAESLAAFKVPEYWQLSVEALPRNATGKILKDQLRVSAA